MSEIEEQEISQIVETGLEEILSGQATLQEVLLRHPDKTEDLRPELEIAMWMVSRQEQVKARPGFVRASRKRVLDKIKQEARGPAAQPKPALFSFRWPRRFALQAVATLLIVAFLVMGSTGVVSASQGTIPGEQLYGVKRFTERVEYQVNAQPAARVESSLRFAGRRLDESEALLYLQRIPEASRLLTEYQKSINDAVFQLSLVSDQQPIRKGQLAATLKNKLARNNDQLNQMVAFAPLEFQADLQQARETTEAVTGIAVEVIEKMEVLAPDATFVPELSTEVSPQSTELSPGLTGTDTAIPGPNATNLPVPAVNTTPDPSIITTDLPAGTTEDDTRPSKEPKPSKTPKPDPSENRADPPKPEKPTEKPKEEGRGGGGSENPPPGKDK